MTGAARPGMSGPPAVVRADPRVIAAYLGQDAASEDVAER